MASASDPTAIDRKESTVSSKNRKIFISYKRNVPMDESIADSIIKAFSEEYDLFIDRKMPVGTNWADRIEGEIRSSEFFVVLLSQDSIHSEMVEGEIETACRYGGQHGTPQILPVRLAFNEPLSHPLSGYLDAINWAVWTSDDDTENLLYQLRCAMEGKDLPPIRDEALPGKTTDSEGIPVPQHAAQPVILDLPEGTIDPQSRFYVEREADKLALATIGRTGVTMTIKGPRQIGKSSILMRSMAHAMRQGKRVAFLDFQLFDKAALHDADRFFLQFASWLTDELDLDDRTEEFWARPIGNTQRCTRYLSKYLLKEVDAPLVLAMDEVETVFDTSFRSDFFAMLRSWHNDRAFKQSFRRLDLVLVTSTEPYQLIENLNQSPFNVGETIQLEDFNLEQLKQLNEVHGQPFRESELEQLHALLGGHPYLVRRALYWVASQRMTVEALFREALEDRGPFGDHLRYHLFRMRGKTDLIEGLRDVISGAGHIDEMIFFRLRGAGLVRRQKDRVVPRCQLYADFFKDYS